MDNSVPNLEFSIIYGSISAIRRDLKKPVLTGLDPYSGNRIYSN